MYLLWGSHLIIRPIAGGFTVLHFSRTRGKYVLSPTGKKFYKILVSLNWFWHTNAVVAGYEGGPGSKLLTKVDVKSQDFGSTRCRIIPVRSAFLLDIIRWWHRLQCTFKKRTLLSLYQDRVALGATDEHFKQASFSASERSTRGGVECCVTMPNLGSLIRSLPVFQPS